MSRFKPSIWRSLSVEAINNAIKSAPPGANLKTLIDAAYPFGSREYTPYKIWLEERKKALLRLNLYKVPKNRKCKYHPNGQTCLLCQEK
ncbi:MAG: hypothetical protein KME54_17510 [Tolypothrix brevis GSE-NOS-MK-07-07A]|jgi:hypothetical protein|nr:hypothetical protein [Tolypothrix brevis GSE-NOS-MK-07-07A]